MTNKHPRPVVANGGTSEYIYQGPKTNHVAKRSINDHSASEVVVCRLTITPRADYVLDQLSAVLGLPRGQVAAYAIEALGLTYNGAVRLLDCRPDLADLLERLASPDI